MDSTPWNEKLQRLLTPERFLSLPPVWRYGLTALIVATATALRWALIPWLGTTVPYNVALVASVCTTLLFGIGPGLISVVAADIAVEVVVLGAFPTISTGTTLLRLGTSMAIGVFFVGLFHGIRVALISARHNQDRLGAMAAASFEGIVESAQGRIVDCNEQFARISGYPVEELRGKDIASLIVPEDRERVLANISQGRESVTEHAMFHKEGSRILVETHGRPVSAQSAKRYTAGRDVTARKRTEEALDRERSLLASIMQATDVMLVSLDTGFNFVWVNAAYAATCNYRPEEMAGKNHFALYPGPETEAIFRRVRDTGEPVFYKDKPFEFPDQPKRGVTYWDWSLVPVKDHSGQVRGLVFSLRETTRFKQAEAALRESHERMKKVLEVQTVGVMFWDLNTGCMTNANDTFLNLMGYSRGEVEARELTWEKLTPPEYLEVSRAEIRKFLATGRVGPYEKEYFRKDGTRQWLVFAGSSLGNNTCVEFCVDISARKNAEAALRESEARFRLALRNSPVSVAVQDRDLRYIWSYNQRAAPPEGVLGKVDSDIFTPEEAEHITAMKRRVLDEGVELREQMWLNRPSDRIYADFCWEPVRDSAGDVIGVGSATVDLTAMKLAQEESQESRTQLKADLDAMICLQKLGTLFVQEGDLERLLTEVVDAAIGISGADFGNIQLFDPKTSDLRIVAHRGFPQWWLDYWNRVSRGHGMCGTALEHGERVIVEDVEHSAIFAGTEALDIQLKAGVRAVQSTPLVSRAGKPLGMFSTHYRKPHRPHERTLALLNLLARQAADIIARALGEEELRATNAELARFNRVTVGRELRIIELKQQVNEMCAKLGEPPRYKTDYANDIKEATA